MVWAGVLSGGSAVAERYLSVAEAQKLCFPQADSFEEREIRFKPHEIAALEKMSAVKVLNLGNRFWVSHQGTNLLGVVVIDHVLGKHEIIDYVVAIAPGGKVLQIEVLEYRESHGTEIRRVKWRDQFKGKTASSPLKLNDDIYNISGATMSCRHVTEGVRRVLATYELVVRPGLLAAGELPNSGTAPKP